MQKSQRNRLTVIVLTFLLIEFLDELVYGARETAWPLIRSDLGLTYTQIGLAISLPGLIGNLIEPALGILGDVWRRRTLILGGGVIFTLSVLWLSQAPGYIGLLLAACLFNPASGAFVSLSQASLMDSEPHRHEQNMARWTFAGSLGVVAGPLALSATVATGLGWRGLLAVLAVLSFAALVLAWRHIPERNGPPEPPDPAEESQEKPVSFAVGARNAWNALRRGEVLRWLVLLEFSDLMLDILFGFLALYLVDVSGLTPGMAAVGVAVWSGVGLLGDFLLIPLLERVRGLDYLRLSVVLELILFPAFLLVQPLFLKLAILGLLGFFNSGWYSVLMGRLYSAMPGQSGTVISISNVTGWFGKLIPLGIGLAAQTFGLDRAMWLLLAGPIVLLIGLPRRSRGGEGPLGTG
jgi:FSR family fosmidomycin resistance protein-like MFS transporter